MAILNEHHGSTLELSREEQWVLHHVLPDRIEHELQTPETADPPPIAVYRAFDKLEAGRHRFSRRERWCLAAQLRRYADAEEAPDRDRSTVASLLDRFQ